MKYSTSRRTVVLIALVLLAAGLPALMRSAASAAPAPTLALSRTSAIASENVTASGILSGAANRPVVLQRRVGTTWTALVNATTTRSGSFSIAFRAPVQLGGHTLRVVTRTGRPVISPARALTVVAQSAALSLPAAASAGSVVTAAVTSRPARPNRLVSLQVLDVATWRTVATIAQDAAGVARASFEVPDEGVTSRYRAVVAASGGAAAKTTAPTDLAVVSGPGDQIATMAVNGPVQPVLIDRVSKRALFAFTTTKRRIVVSLTQATWPNTCCPRGQLILRASTGALIEAADLNPNGLLIFEEMAAGSYVVEIDLQADGLGRGLLRVTSPNDQTEPTVLNGPEKRVVIDEIAERAYYSFTATAGMRTVISVRAATWLNSCCPRGQLRLLDADTRAPVQSAEFSPDSFLVEEALAAGRYLIEVDPRWAEEGQAMLRLSSPPNQTGALVVNGDEVLVNIDDPAKRARFTLTANQGQRLVLSVRAATWRNFCCPRGQLRLLDGVTGAVVQTAELGPNATLIRESMDGGTYIVEVDLASIEEGTGRLRATS